MKKDAKVQLRLPEDVHQWLVKWAEKNDRSMNGQVVSILRGKMQEQTLEDNPATGMLGG